MRLTQEIAKEVWRYEPKTGHFFWRVKPSGPIAAGKRAGHFDGKYWRLMYGGKVYKASRVAWLIETGEWPKGQVDHINCDKLDDRIVNLREATIAENARNKKVRADNKTKTKGVTKAGNGYQALIMKDGKMVYLGYFKTISDAKVVYDAAAKQYHGEFARL